MWRRVWIWKRRLKNGHVYCLRWHDDTGRVRTETVGPDRKLAERMRSKREDDLNAGRLRTIRRISFDEFKQEELEAMKGRMAASSLEDLEDTLNGFGTAVKAAALADVTPAMVERYFSGRLAEVEVATANKNLRTLKASLTRAVRRGYLESNPAGDVRPVREPERELRVLSPDEVGKLLGACWSVRWKALVALAVTTGMRLGEMLALRWDAVDLQVGVVRARNSRDHLTKSRRNRVLALLPAVCDLLRQLPVKGPFVFHTRDGRQWCNNVKQRFRKLVERAGIAYCSMHDLRRTFISHLAMADVNEAVVKELAGHASIGTTLKFYTRINEQAMRAAQAKLPFGKVLQDVSDTYHGAGKPQESETARAATGTLAAS